MKKLRSCFAFFFIIFLCFLETAKASSVDSTLSISLLSRLLQIHSVSENEKEAGEFVKNFCDSVGLYTRVFTNEKGSYNFAASIYPLSEKKPNIILEGHLDVVPANDSLGWNHAPYSGAIAENAVWGRGAIDNKGPLTASLLALLPFIKLSKTTNLPYNITFLALSGEEEGGLNGAKIIAEKYLEELNTSVMWGEGGMGLFNIIPSKPNTPFFGIAVTEKNPLWVEVSSSNKSFGHGSMGSGKNAAETLIAALSKLSYIPTIKPKDECTKTMMKEIGEAEGGVKGHIIKNYHLGLYWEFVKNKFRKDSIFYAFSQSTYSVTQLYTPLGSVNSIPQEASAIIDFRLMPEINPNDFLENLQTTMGNSIHLKVLLKRNGTKQTIPEENYAAMCKATAIHFSNPVFTPYLFPAISDNNYFREKGVAVFGFFPFIASKEILSSIHNKNERMPIDKYLLSIQIFIDYLSLMEKVAIQ